MGKVSGHDDRLNLTWLQGGALCSARSGPSEVVVHSTTVRLRAVSRRASFSPDPLNYTTLKSKQTVECWKVGS